MKNKKPIGWPEYMEPKRINGVVRYYWNAPTWARKRDCPIKSEALGTDYAQAKARCDDVINPIFDSWRTGGASDDQITSRRVVTGTFDWLAGVYKKSPKYTRKPERTRKSYDGALRLVAEYILTNGHRFGSLALKSIQPGTADTDADGSSSLGTGAMIAYYWLQREEDIFMRFAWSDYRPPDNPDRVMIWHHKNHDERIPVPLFDIDGTALWPEMTTRMESVRRAGTLIVMRDRPDPKKKVHLPWMTGGKNPMRYVQSEVRRICRGAGIPDDITFTSFRHGGHTEGADAGLTDAQMRALGGHKTTAALLRYAKETDAQRQVGGRKRLNARTKTGDLSE
jgi:hypothetical protein